MQSLLNHINELRIFENQRKGWLVLSVFVIICVIGIIVCWNTIQQNNLVWLVSSIGLIISTVWWYWTMRFIRLIIVIRQEESMILLELIKEICKIKQIVWTDFKK